ncbi:MAG: hypothetical protein R3B68_14430 [Phycisphaerales bacterium]
MNLIKAAVFGLVAGAIGAAIWAAVAFFTNFEIGWIAWGIGALVGLGVRAGAGSEDGWTPGILAAVIAVASVVGGKYAAAAAFMNQTMGTAMAPATALEAEESAIVVLADEVVAEKDKRGEAIDWPPGIGGWEDAYTQADYPADIWGEASRRWDATPACYREAARFTPTIASEQVRVSQVAHLIVAESGATTRPTGSRPRGSSIPAVRRIPRTLWSQGVIGTRGWTTPGTRSSRRGRRTVSTASTARSRRSSAAR